MILARSPQYGLGLNGGIFSPRPTRHPTHMSFVENAVTWAAKSHIAMRTSVLTMPGDVREDVRGETPPAAWSSSTPNPAASGCKVCSAGTTNVAVAEMVLESISKSCTLRGAQVLVSVDN